MIIYYYDYSSITKKSVKLRFFYDNPKNTFTKNINGELFFHREGNLPACTINNITSGGEYYFVDGLLHREDGPAFIYWKKSTNKSDPEFYEPVYHSQIYYYKGMKINIDSDEDFKQYIRLVNFK